VTGGKLIRAMAALSVLAVAAVAATVSFTHLQSLALAHGQTLLASRALPVSVDGTIVAASMVMLDTARRGAPAPVLARVLLATGVLATLAANAAYGAAHGTIGILVSAWPAIAFVGSAETFLGMVRVRVQAVPEAPVAEALFSPSRAPEGGQEAVPASQPPARTRPASPALPSARSRARRVRAPEHVFAAELEAGQLPGVRAIKHRMRCGQDKATRIRGELAALMSALGETVEATS
jgi:Protein of unknown function (DUF2637)